MSKRISKEETKELIRLLTKFRDTDSDLEPDTKYEISVILSLLYVDLLVIYDDRD